MIQESLKATSLYAAQRFELYQQNGYVTLKQVFDLKEVEAMQLECERLMQRFQDADESNLRAGVRNSVTGKPILDRFDPVVDVSPLFASIANDDRLLNPIGELFRDRAMLFKDKLIFKRPGTHGYRAHQDYTYWHELGCPPEYMLSALVAIDDSQIENGALAIYPGLHHHYLGKLETPKEIFNPQHGLANAEHLQGVEPHFVPLQAGDVLIFHSLAPHESGVNNSQKSRRSLFLTYTAAKYGDLYENYYRRFRSYLTADRRQAHHDIRFE